MNKKQILKELEEANQLVNSLRLQNNDLNNYSINLLRENRRLKRLINGNEFRKLYEEIKAWQVKTFLKGKKPPFNQTSVLKHLQKEIKEVLAKPNDRIEWADMLLLVLGGYTRQFDYQRGQRISILTVAKRKLEINKKRKWGKPNKQGFVEHVRS